MPVKDKKRATRMLLAIEIAIYILIAAAMAYAIIT
jgi:hypothetical protein